MSHNETEPKEIKLSKQLLWLADAPLFIDDRLVAAFHDAIVRPLFRFSKFEDEQTNSRSNVKTGALELEAGAEGGSFLQAFTFGWKPSVKLTAEGEVSATSDTAAGKKIELLPIDTPQRQLEQLAIYYSVNAAGRLQVVNDTQKDFWRSEDLTVGSPRTLVFLDLPSQQLALVENKPAVKLIPTAAEFENGRIELIYERLRGKQKTGPQEMPPPYPDGSDATPAELKEQRKQYWNWFDTNFSATKCMVAVEQAAAENGRIRWIDFRLPLTKDGDTLHLHICPRGNYDTGVLAYSFIKRGFKHGIRLVGTLKSEPDLNVLAIYER